MFKIEKNKIKNNFLLFISIVYILVLTIHLMFGIFHQSNYVNSVFIISFILILVNNLANIKKFKEKNRKRIFQKIISGIMIILLFITLLSFSFSFGLVRREILDKYSLGQNTKQSLKTIYFNEGGGGPVCAVYDRKLPLGFKCERKIICKQKSDKPEFNLKVIYINTSKTCFKK